MNQSREAKASRPQPLINNNKNSTTMKTKDITFTATYKRGVGYCFNVYRVNGWTSSDCWVTIATYATKEEADACIERIKTTDERSDYGRPIMYREDGYPTECRGLQVEEIKVRI